MKLDKWVKFRIFLVFLGIAYLFIAIMFRFMYLQLKDHLIVAFLFIALATILFIYFVINFLNEMNLQSRNIYKCRKYNESTIVEQSIIDLLSNYKIRKSAINYIVLLSSYLVFIYFHMNYSKIYFNFVTGIILVLIVLIFIDVCLLEYRIKRGYYGSNDYEAREIIRFILSMPSNYDFRGGEPFNNLFESQEQYRAGKLKEEPDRIKGVID